VIGFDTPTNIVYTVFFPRERAAFAYGQAARRYDAVCERTCSRALARGQPQDRLVIRRQSGSGKSTILRLIWELQPIPARFFFKGVLRGCRVEIATDSRHIEGVSILGRSARGPVRDNVARATGRLTTKFTPRNDEIVDKNRAGRMSKSKD